MSRDRVIKLCSRPGAARHDTRVERTCCDGKCLQRNPSQGGSCPAQRDDPAPVRPSGGEMAAIGLAAAGALACAAWLVWSAWSASR